MCKSQFLSDHSNRKLSNCTEQRSTTDYNRQRNAKQRGQTIKTETRTNYGDKAVSKKKSVTGNSGSGKSEQYGILTKKKRITLITTLVLLINFNAYRLRFIIYRGLSDPNSLSLPC